MDSCSGSRATEPHSQKDLALAFTRKAADDLPSQAPPAFRVHVAPCTLFGCAQHCPSARRTRQLPSHAPENLLRSSQHVSSLRSKRGVTSGQALPQPTGIHASATVLVPARLCLRVEHRGIGSPWLASSRMTRAFASGSRRLHFAPATKPQSGLRSIPALPPAANTRAMPRQFSSFLTGNLFADSQVVLVRPAKK